MQGSEDGEVDEQAAKAQEARDTEPATGSDSDGDSAPEDQQAAPTRAGAPKKRKAVWEDPDDKSLQVDIAAVRRLRKLRSAEAETTITGVQHFAHGLMCRIHTVLIAQRKGALDWNMANTDIQINAKAYKQNF